MKKSLVLFIFVYGCALRGEQGETGETTIVEIEGPQGEPGVQGPPGPEGSLGPKGLRGNRGPQGEVGPMGTTGSVGPQGPTGEPGAMGTQGPQGIPGPEGSMGMTGTQGTRGETGSVGKQGEVGPMGPAGIQGEQGLQGISGPQGDIGPAGTDGPMGPSGQQGSQGEQGLPGPVGPQGAEGPQGPPGEPPPISCPVGTTEIWAGEFLSYCLQPVSDPPPSLTWPQCVRHCSEQGLSLVSFEKLIVSCVADPLLFPETARNEGNLYWISGLMIPSNNFSVSRVASRTSATADCPDMLNFCDRAIAFTEEPPTATCGLARFLFYTQLHEGVSWPYPSNGCLCGTDPR